MKFTKVKKKRLYIDVLFQLQEYLIKEKVSPGQRLPSERELALMFGVSRISIREALAILETKGLVERKVGGGTFSTGTANFAVTSLMQEVAKKQGVTKEPMEVRRVIEPKLAGLAAKNISDKLLLKLKTNLDRQKQKLMKGQDITDLDREFHFTIAKATKNSIFTGLLEALRYALEDTRAKSLNAPEGVKVSYLGHEAIYAALESRNPDKAEKAMADHIIQVEKLILDYLAEQERASKT
ncbi:MAG: FadR family transcriptional regulator [Syntrophorhabdaceae bacterium]|nr:FadR family transcriptional regulator [Syntrophorhabdaceae bacterium]